MKPTSTSDLIDLAHSIAVEHALDPVLVSAIAEQESSWDTHAIRYEPSFRSRYVAPLKLPLTEEIARSMSWGLMQVMGQTARETGFSETYLSALCDPSTGLGVGCVVFAAKLFQASGDVCRALLLWNGGSNASYASEVLSRLERYR